MLAKIPNNNRSKAIKIRKRFNTINKYIYNLGIKSNNKHVMNNTSNNENVITLVLNMLYELKIPSYSVIKNKFNVYKLIIKENISSLNTYNEEITKYNNIYNLSLNFKRNRFFSCFDMNTSKKIIFNSSLGIISKRFSDKKSYLKSKSSYIMSSSYARRILIYLSINRMQMSILKTPKFLKDIINTLTTNSNSLYKNPFIPSKLVNEKEQNPVIYFEYVVFINNKTLGPLKKKKKGRLKRKISKKIIAYNNILD